MWLSISFKMAWTKLPLVTILERGEWKVQISFKNNYAYIYIDVKCTASFLFVFNLCLAQSQEMFSLCYII